MSKPLLIFERSLPSRPRRGPGSLRRVPRQPARTAGTSGADRARHRRRRRRPGRHPGIVEDGRQPDRRPLQRAHRDRRRGHPQGAARRRGPQRASLGCRSTAREDQRRRGGRYLDRRQRERRAGLRRARQRPSGADTVPASGQGRIAGPLPRGPRHAGDRKSAGLGPLLARWTGWPCSGRTRPPACT